MHFQYSIYIYIYIPIGIHKDSHHENSSKPSGAAEELAEW